MALTFGALTSDTVSVGSGASLDNLDPWTMLAWVYPTTFTAGRIILQKGQLGTNTRKLMSVQASGALQGFADRASVDCNYVSTSAQMALNTWCFVAVSYNSASTPVIQMYSGRLGVAAAAVASFSTSTNGSGATQADAAENMHIGNSPVGNVAFQGRIAVAAYVNAELSLGQILDWQFRPRVVPSTKGFWILGHDGASAVPDLSGNGNAGAITGATLTPDHVPLPMPFGRADGWAPYVVAAAAATQKFRRTLSPFGARIGSRQIHGGR